MVNVNFEYHRVAVRDYNSELVLFNEVNVNCLKLDFSDVKLYESFRDEAINKVGIKNVMYQGRDSLLD
jgi:hypothetical protein